MEPGSGVRRWGFRYRAHNGVPRLAVLLLPERYGPESPPPALPLVISPHGRGIRGVTNADWWRDLPGRGDFAVVCPGGMGRRLPLHSWGWHGQIDDLARMPDLALRAKPWLRIDRSRIYAVGGSMGGQETLLLIARHPGLLAGAAAFDSVTNLYTRYRDFALISNGRRLQFLARIEVGGTPATNADAYVQRSPVNFVKAIARSGVPVSALVEQGRRDRRRPGQPVRPVLPRAARARPAGDRRAGARLVEPHGGDLLEPRAAGRM